jgi:hypothetical protein
VEYFAVMQAAKPKIQTKMTIAFMNFPWKKKPLPLFEQVSSSGEITFSLFGP